jgi:predicted GNAT family N-acyltransferase
MKVYARTAVFVSPQYSLYRRLHELDYGERNIYFLSRESNTNSLAVQPGA